MNLLLKLFPLETEGTPVFISFKKITLHFFQCPVALVPQAPTLPRALVPRPLVLP